MLVAVILIVCDCFGWLISYSGYLITFVGCLCLLDCLKLLFWVILLVYLVDFGFDLFAYCVCV